MVTYRFGCRNVIQKLTPHLSKQVQKALWTQKASACLLTLLYAYGKTGLCINIHHYTQPYTVLQQATALHALRRQYIAQYREH